MQGKARTFRGNRSHLSLWVIVVFASVVAWLVVAVIFGPGSHWAFKDWHLVAGDLLFFVFGFILAMYHERSLDKEAELTTALGDLEMLEKIVVVRTHTGHLLRCTEQLKDPTISQETSLSEARGHALSLFGDARAGMSLFRYARPAYQEEFAVAIEKAVEYAVGFLDLDGVCDIAERFAEEACALPEGHGVDMSGQDDHMSAEQADDMSAASRSLLKAVAREIRSVLTVAPAAPSTEIPQTRDR